MHVEFNYFEGNDESRRLLKLGGKDGKKVEQYQDEKSCSR